MKHDFKYISKHDPTVRQAYSNLNSLIREVQLLVRDKYTFQFYPVGSYARNMITYDTKSNVGFDFDINIEPNDEGGTYPAKQLRKTFQNALNQIAPKYGFDYPEASTRVLTIKVKDRKNSRIIYSCDFAIVNDYKDEDGYDCQEYIRFNKSHNSYGWCEQPDGYYMLPNKIEWAKESGLWGEVRKRYIEKKDENSDPHIHSRTIFAQTVHEICQKYGFYNEE